MSLVCGLNLICYFPSAQLAQRVMPHLGDVRSAKAPFQLSAVLSFVKQIAASTVGKGKKGEVPSWESVGDFFTQVVQEASRLLPLALEAENVVKSESRIMTAADM